MKALFIETTFSVANYSLDLTLDSGQAFRWRKGREGWDGLVNGRWVRLRQFEGGIHAEAALPVTEWAWLEYYLQVNEDLGRVLAAFPADKAMQAAVSACHGLRLLRQDPWECLASFICSSTKQIVQIRQIIETLCVRYGEPVIVPDKRDGWRSFPEASRIASADEKSLRECKLGFRAPYLLSAARAVADGTLDLESLRNGSVEEAREALMALPGVGRKIADCVLLFAYGFQVAFPVDVWIRRALVQYYFRGQTPGSRQTQAFTTSYFGAYAGYAQQYLFHYIRWKGGMTYPQRSPTSGARNIRKRSRRNPTTTGSSLVL